MPEMLSPPHTEIPEHGATREQNPYAGLRIAVVHGADPADPGSYSGSASHLLAALRGLEVDVRPVSAALPAAVAGGVAAGTVARWIATQAGVRGRPHQRMSLAPLARESARAQSWLGRRRLAAQGSLDGAVVVAASELGPLVGVRYVTYDDMTVRQAARFPHWLMGRLPPADLRARAVLQECQFRHARAVCTNTWWARDSVVADYAITASKVRVVGFGGRPRRIPGGGSLTARSASAPRFLYVSRDWARKGGEVLLRAFARVQAAQPSARLDVVGHHPPIDQAGVQTHGRLALDDSAAQRRLDALFTRATCLVMPSAIEPSGLALVEAGSCGLPSIVGSIGGATEVIGGGGIAVEPGDHVALAGAMIRLCDLELAARLGELARRQVRQLTWELTARRILAALGCGAQMGDLPRVTSISARAG
jgi:glycosyltransferase involved in cell wall biosynthesis